MTDAEYRAEVVQEWPAEDEKARVLRELAEEYRDRCDSYDNAHCSGGTYRGEKMPRDSYEFAKINRHAHAACRELKQKAIDAGATAEEWLDAMREALR